jgi:hypothetical protein
MILFDSKSEIRKPGPLWKHASVHIRGQDGRKGVPTMAVLGSASTSGVISFAGHAIVGFAWTFAECAKAKGGNELVAM